MRSRHECRYRRRCIASPLPRWLHNVSAMMISNKSYLAFRVFAGADLRLDLMNIFAKTAYVYPFTQIL